MLKIRRVPTQLLALHQRRYRVNHARSPKLTLMELQFSISDISPERIICWETSLGMWGFGSRYALILDTRRSREESERSLELLALLNNLSEITSSRDKGDHQPQERDCCWNIMVTPYLSRLWSAMTGVWNTCIYIYRTPSCIRISIKQYIYHLLITGYEPRDASCNPWNNAYS